jgi:hypothetical protein
MVERTSLFEETDPVTADQESELRFWVPDDPLAEKRLIDVLVEMAKCILEGEECSEVEDIYCV